MTMKIRKILAVITETVGPEAPITSKMSCKAFSILTRTMLRVAWRRTMRTFLPISKERSALLLEMSA